MLLLAQTDPAWEYWDTSTYVAIAIAVTLITAVTAWLVLRRWRITRAQDQRRAN